MKQSAMQELKWFISDGLDNFDESVKVSEIWAKINELLEMEKQQIIDAHFQGVKETVLNLSEHINIPKTLKTIQEIENGTGKHEEGEDYYNDTFNK